MAAPQPEDDPLDWAIAYAELGWRVLPIKPGGKHPPMASWQHAATSDATKLPAWWRGLYRGHGVGIATGRGMFALDVDVANGKRGAETLAALEAEHGPLPVTVTSITGSGGLHKLFHGDARNNAGTKLGPGLDIRGDGGQIVVAPTVHPNGVPYRWADGLSPWDVEVAQAPAWLMAKLNAAPAAPERAALPVDVPRGLSLGSDDSIAEWINAQYHWHDLLRRDGWTEHHATGDETHWTRPGKPASEGSSAVLHEPDGPLVVFSTDATLSALFQPWAATSDGLYALSLFGYLAATRYGGDRSALARDARIDRNRLERGVVAPTVAAMPAAVAAEPPTLAADGLEWEDVAHWGGDALQTYGDVASARWGDGERMLWAQGESLLIAGRTGVGKTTLTLSILAGLVGIESHVLGLPVHPANRVLYLAMDRPRQIIRAMRRRFGPEHYATLNDKLVVRRGPLPAGLDKVPDMLLSAARRYGADVVIVDSLKDAAVKLTDDEVGGQINRAIQFLNAANIDALVLHHNRKGDATQKQGDDYEPSVEDVYGSNWITAGAGSVLILHGTPGAELVKLWHVKQPAEPLGPWMLEHDHNTGRTRIAHAFDLLAYLRSRGEDGATAFDAARAEHPDKSSIKSNGKEAARSKRRLDGLVKAGLARRIDGVGRDARGQQNPDRWVAEPVDNPVTGAVTHPPKTRDGARDGVVENEPVTEPCRPVTLWEKPQVTAVTHPVTPRDASSAVTGAGGYIPPPATAGALLDPVEPPAPTEEDTPW